MVFKIAIALLIAWLLGVLGAYTIGQLVHVLLLVGLMLLLLSTSRALDARRGVEMGSEDASDQKPSRKTGTNRR